MIYTVTYNPSLDYIVKTPVFALGETNRAAAETLCPGGKGVNVALVLRNLGHACRAFVFTAGFVGDEIERRLTAAGHDCEFIRVSGNSRINVKIKSGEETELNGIGAPASDAHTEALIVKLSALQSGDWLDLSGNTARGTSLDAYRRLMTAAGAGVRVALDAHGELLRSALPLRPYIVKPNLDELGDLFGVRAKAADVPRYAVKLIEAGARNAIVSLGADGAVFAAEDGRIYRALPPQGTLVNSTGAGDSLVAGFIAACEEGKTPVETFRFAVAAGSACAYGEGLATRAATEALAADVKITTL